MKPHLKTRKGSTGKFSPRLVIFSGGQTGADRAALEWAVGAGIQHGGWCPKGRLAEDGIIPKQYRLKETETSDYPVRTERNVEDSDGTVIFTIDKALRGGCALTVHLAWKYSKPFLHLHKHSEDAGSQLAEFIRSHQINRLNVAGSRASKEPSIGEFVTTTLNDFLKRI